MKQSIVFFFMILLLSCGKSEKVREVDVQYPHSFANAHQAIVKHLDLIIKVSFDDETISGKAS